MCGSVGPSKVASTDLVDVHHLKLALSLEKDICLQRMSSFDIPRVLGFWLLSLSKNELSSRLGRGLKFSFCLIIACYWA